MTTENQPQKTSKELATAIEKKMWSLWHAGAGWTAIFNIYAITPLQRLYQVAELVLAQQRDIEQLKAELEEVKRKLEG